MGSVKHQKVTLLSLKFANIIIIQIVLDIQFNWMPYSFFLLSFHYNRKLCKQPHCIKIWRKEIRSINCLYPIFQSYMQLTLIRVCLPPYCDGLFLYLCYRLVCYLLIRCSGICTILSAILRLLKQVPQFHRVPHSSRAIPDQTIPVILTVCW